MRTIQAKPLTADAFRQYGTFWSAVDGEGYGLGGGFFTFYPDRIAVADSVDTKVKNIKYVIIYNM